LAEISQAGSCFATSLGNGFYALAVIPSDADTVPEEHTYEPMRARLGLIG
jgi:hypothetical protein